jgi:energy-coupling factor transporter ATP-binding protein EcfA2
VAPYEWSFPYHEWVETSLREQLRSRLHLPVAETLHLAHVLAQTVVGLLTGANRQGQETKGNKKLWTSHIFGPKDGSGRQTVVNFFARLEFQDGKRKRYVNFEEVAAQYYHGRGTVHVHLLIWLENIEAIGLEQSIAATAPTDNEPLRSLVEGSQRSYSGSGWPVQEEPSYYSAEEGLLKLQHLPSDFCTLNAKGVPEGLRAYILDLLSSLRCHLDVQSSDGRGMLLRYVSGYVPKFSDSFTTEWLNDACSDYVIARRVLIDYHPLEPEMVLQLAMQWFPQCFAGGSLHRFVVPVPWSGTLHKRVQQYMESAWRAEEMCLAEYIRKSNKNGEIQKWLQKRYAAAVKEGETSMSLATWASNARCLGETMTAAMYLSRYNDRYYGQWVLMLVPFRSMADLWRPELDFVPAHLVNQALAMLHRPEHWCNPDAIRADLELEAFREHHIHNITAMIAANQSLIAKYIDGTLDKKDDPEPEYTVAMGETLLAPDQGRIATEIVDCVKEGMTEKQRQDDAWQGAGDEQQSGFTAGTCRRPAFAVLGPAGSGKTTAVQAAINVVHENGGRVLVVAPTGRLAATLREKFPYLDVDTVHGAFLVWKPVQETLELMLPYDLVIVEEVGQLSRWIFERIMQLWNAAGELPTLVFVGDFWQLPGVEPTTALDSPLWHSRRMRKRELHTMRRCKCDMLRQKLELLRTGKPSKQQLRFILKGHKAPSLGRAGYNMNLVPTIEDVGHILGETPQTLFLTISRKACAHLNHLALRVLFDGAVPMAYLPTDPESNIENYEGSKMVRQEPSELPIFPMARIVLTKNLNKSIGFVNGMGATVLGMDNGNVIVRTDQGRRLSVHPWSSDQNVKHFPFRLGYASTLHKVQGATLDHITLWLDVANMPAAGYVALSRVEYDANWRFVGDPSVHHFTPARF